MTENQRETAFLRHLICYDESDECSKLQKNIAQIQYDERCVLRVALVTALFLLLAMAGIGYGAILQENFPYNGSNFVFRILCELGLASLICLMALAVLLAIYRKKLNRLRGECRQLVTSPPGVTPGQASHRNVATQGSSI